MAEAPHGLPEKIGTVIGSIVLFVVFAVMLYAIGSAYI
jgi:hypothetical protein